MRRYRILLLIFSLLLIEAFTYLINNFVEGKNAGILWTVIALLTSLVHFAYQDTKKMLLDGYIKILDSSIEVSASNLQVNLKKMLRDVRQRWLYLVVAQILYVTCCALAIFNPTSVDAKRLFDDPIAFQSIAKIGCYCTGFIYACVVSNFLLYHRRADDFIIEAAAEAARERRKMSTQTLLTKSMDSISSIDQEESTKAHNRMFVR